MKLTVQKNKPSFNLTNQNFILFYFNSTNLKKHPLLLMLFICLTFSISPSRSFNNTQLLLLFATQLIFVTLFNELHILNISRNLAYNLNLLKHVCYVLISTLPLIACLFDLPQIQNPQQPRIYRPRHNTANGLLSNTHNNKTKKFDLLKYDPQLFSLENLRFILFLYCSFF